MSTNEMTHLLQTILSQQLSPKAWQWFQEAQNKATEMPAMFFMGFSAIPRYVGKEPLIITEEMTSVTTSIHQDWDLSCWSQNQLARVHWVLEYHASTEIPVTQLLTDLLDTADSSEQVAIYQGLAFFPHPADHHRLVTEGLRTNMQNVFESIACNNPYPTSFLSQEAWNQMILKSLFLEVPLTKILGVSERNNPELETMKELYCQERRAAGRPVPKSIVPE